MASIKTKASKPIIVATTALLVAATPFAVSPAVYDQFRLVKEITAQGLIVIIAVAWYVYALWPGPGRPSPWKTLVQTPLLIPIAVLLLYAWGGLLFSDHAHHGWKPLLNLLLYSLLFAILAQQSQVRFVQIVLYVAMAAGALNSLYSIAQYYGHDPLFHLDFGRTKVEGRIGTAGFLDNPNVAGAYFSLVFCAGLALLKLEGSLWRKGLVFAGLALNLAGLFFTQTLAALAGAIAGLLVWTGFMYAYEESARKYLITLLVVILGGMALAITFHPGLRARLDAAKTQWQAKQWDALLSRRYTIWTTTMAMIKDRPFIGHGLGSYGALFFDYRRIVNQRGNSTEPLTEIALEAHNEYLQIWAELGLLGLLLFLAIIFVYVREQIKRIEHRGVDDDLPSSLRSQGLPEKPAGTDSGALASRWMAIGALAVMANVLVNALANFPFHTAATASLIIVILGLNQSARTPSGAAAVRTGRATPEEKLVKWGGAVAGMMAGFWMISYVCRPYTASRYVLHSFLTLNRVQNQGLAPGENLRSILANVGALLEKAKPLYPTNPDIYMLRGATYRWDQRLEPALKEYQTSAGYRPTPEVYIALGRVYLDLQQPDKAREVFRKLQEFNPASEAAQKGLAEAEALLNRKASP